MVALQNFHARLVMEIVIPMKTAFGPMNATHGPIQPPYLGVPVVVAGIYLELTTVMIHGWRTRINRRNIRLGGMIHDPQGLLVHPKHPSHHRLSQQVHCHI